MKKLLSLSLLLMMLLVPLSMHAQTTETLLFENFDSMGSISTSYSEDGWYAYNAGQGNNWTISNDMDYVHSEPYSATYYYSNHPANCYLVSKPFNVNADMKELVVSLWEIIEFDFFTERFEVFFVKASDITNISAVVSATHYGAIASADYYNDSYAQVSGSNNNSDLAGQSVRLVIHCTSKSDEYELYIDDITVTETCFPEGPYVALEPASTTIVVNSTKTLTAHYGHITDTPTITYSSSNTDVATVSGNGSTVTVTAIAPGEVTITATMNGTYTGSCSITVEPQTYCTPSFTQSDNYIVNFLVGNIYNINSGYSTNGYGDFTNLTTRLEQGASVVASLTRGDIANSGIAVWIDYDDDYIFESSESVGMVNVSSTDDATIDIDLAIPADAPLGRHRMRVVYQYGVQASTIDPCTSVHDSYGEAEDYMVNITGPAPADLTVSDITYNSATMSWTSDALSYDVQYRAVGYHNDIVTQNGFEDGTLGDWTMSVIGDSPEGFYGWRAYNASALVEGGEYGNHYGHYSAISCSWYGQAINADNWLISPQIYFGGTMKFWVYSKKTSNNTDHDEYEVRLSTGGNAASDFTVVLKELSVATTPWEEVTVDLSRYEGLSGYVAIRHKHSGGHYLLVDDICITDMVSNNSWSDALTVNGNSISFDDLAANTEYEVRMRAVYGENNKSSWVTTTFTTLEAPSFTKDITAYTQDGGWYLIASPVGTVKPEEVTNMLKNDYDLYYFDQTKDLEWINYEDASDGGFDLVSGKGYLYANSGDVTLAFSGIPYSSTGTFDLTYDANAGFKGWNLIGNPFSTAATIDRPFYRMNRGGTDFAAQVEVGNSVEAMEGVFVQATGAEQSATFTAASTRGNGNETAGTLNIAVAKALESSTVILDQAIVRFDGGQTLDKFCLNEDTKLYIPIDGADYAIVSAGENGELPLDFKAADDGRYTISVNPQGVTMKDMHLIDILTGADIDLKETPSYSFEHKTTDFESRFKLVFALAPSSDWGTEEDFAFYDGNVWVITEDHPGAAVQIIDVMGRVVYSGSGVRTVSTNNMAPGVYILRLVNDDAVKSQKIVVR